MNHLKILLTAFSLLFSSMVFASDFSYIRCEELKEMIDSKKAGLVIIDSRSSRQYAESRIPGAVNLPLSVMEQDPGLPDVPRDAVLVFYCSGNT